MCFAEKILDSMVNECGYCGERGLSQKQFNILSRNLNVISEKTAGGWSGHYGGLTFYETIYDGFIGKYHVRLKHFSHFNNRYTVVMVEPWTNNLPDMTQSEYQYKEKMRVDMDLLVVKERCFFNDYGTFTHVYTFVDELNNCYVWFASKEQPFCVGDVCKLRATVKNHQEFGGIKQTVISRGKVLEVCSKQNVGLNGLKAKDRAYRDSLL